MGESQIIYGNPDNLLDAVCITAMASLNAHEMFETISQNPELDDKGLYIVFD